METFAKDQERRWAMKLVSLWSERLILGEVFAMIQDRQPVAAAEGFAAR